MSCRDYDSLDEQLIVEVLDCAKHLGCGMVNIGGDRHANTRNVNISESTNKKGIRIVYFDSAQKSTVDCDAVIISKLNADLQQDNRKFLRLKR